MKPESLEAYRRIIEYQSNPDVRCSATPCLFCSVACHAHRSLGGVCRRCEKLPIANEKSAFEKDATVRRR